MRIADRFKSFRMQKHATTNNIVDRIESAEASGRDRFNSFTRADRLDTLSTNTGTLVADALISPAADVTSIEPTDSTFTGVAMGGEGWTFGSTVYHFVAVASGALQAGFNYLGKLIAGGGAVTLDADGISIDADDTTTNSIKFIDGATVLSHIRNTSTVSPQLLVRANAVSGQNTSLQMAAYQAAGQSASLSLLVTSSTGINNFIAMGTAGTEINSGGEDIDTVIKGDTTTIATFDAGLNAMGVGGAAESGKIAKFTGDIKVTGGLELGTNLPVTEIANGVDATAFTPTIVGSSTAGAGTYTTQVGHYARIGNIVFYSITLVWTAHTGTGNLRIGGLPVTAANNGNFPPASVYFSNLTLAAAGNKVMVIVNANSTIMLAYEVGSGASSLLQLDTAGSLYLSGIYFA